MMKSIEFLDKNKKIQDELLNFIRNDENYEESFQNLQTLFDELNIRNDKHDLTTLLHLITKIGNNHHRGLSFFDKIEQIIIIFKDDIKNFFANSEIFNIFRSNKRILLFLIEEKILIFDEYIAKKITTEKYVKKCYPQYFLPEIKPFINKNWFPKYNKKDNDDKKDYSLKNNYWVEEIKKELPEDFYEKRKTGENESYICELIRNDSVENFVQYITRNCYSLNSRIPQSNYETNSFLIKNQSSLIEYAAFYGSIEIFQYLKLSNAEMEKELWFYAIHGNNPEIIHLLEENLAKPKTAEYKKYFIESIKCHHNDIANYFQDNYVQDQENNEHDTFIQSLKYYNFSFISNDFIKKSSFFEICKYDYYLLSSFFLEEINISAIQNHIFQLDSKSYLSIKFKIISFNKIQNHIFQ